MKINTNVAISESGSLFHPLTGDFFTINPLGVEIFKMLKAENSFDEIMQSVLSKYDIDRITFERDYIDFTTLLSQYSLIESED
ncbi:MAG: PqqD family protein [Bacteroidales bacterium]